MFKKNHLLIIFFSFAAISFVSLAYAQTDSAVPSWIKNTAAFWSNNQISDNEFLNAIKYLLENNIIVLKTETNETEEKFVTASTPVTKPRLNYCVILHSSYKDLGQIRFQTKYSHVNYIQDCIKLYKDPLWSYKGDDRTEQLYEKFLKFRQEAKKLPIDPKVTIQSSTQIGTEKFLVKFNVCAGDLSLEKAKILVKSEIEAIEIGSSKDITSNACRTYEAQLHAKHVANIKASIVEQVLIDETS